MGFIRITSNSQNSILQTLIFRWGKSWRPEWSSRKNFFLWKVKREKKNLGDKINPCVCGWQAEKQVNNDEDNEEMKKKVSLEKLLRKAKQFEENCGKRDGKRKRVREKKKSIRSVELPKENKAKRINFAS